MKKLFALCLAVLSLGFNSSAFSDQTIRFAMEATYPPFEYMNPKGEILGFDVDVAKALCNQIQAQCQFSNQPWNSLIPSLKLGKFDALISSIAITPEREKQVSFTAPYYINSAVFVSPLAENLQISKAGLQGKSIGVQEGTVLEQYINQTFGNGVIVKTYPSILDAFLDLQSGRVNAVFTDTPIAKDWLAKQPTKNFVEAGQPIEGGSLFQEGFGIAVRKGNQQLLNQLNQALAAIKQNGTYDKIYQQYFEKKP
jgi:arginine transport system substrate-binding protein